MTPETVELARLQFALTAGAHFVFVALTLGLATLVACLQLRATFSRRPVHAQMVRFWGQLYVINYAMGILTGLVMELQFGLAWSGLTHFAGNVFGSALAMETLVAFFIESTFLALWIFGWGRLNRWVHLAVIWVVTLTAYASAYWILVANGFMQNPVGAELDGDTLVLTDVAAVLSNDSTIGAFWHILAGALVTAGILVAGVSAYHLRRGTPHTELFGRSLRIGVYTALPALFVVVVSGGIQLSGLDDIQPMKVAAFSHDTARIGALELELAERLGPGEYAPPGLARAAALVMLMVFVLLFLLLGLNALLASSRWLIVRARAWHLLLMAMVPLPYVAMIAGWVFREMGRQPWVVYEMLTVSDAVSDIPDSAMRASLVTFTALFGVLIAVTGWLMVRHARSDPATVALGSTAPTAFAPADGTGAGRDERPDPSAAVLTFVGR
ncbi:cytochrome ubiquinol oxidase subunit I [Phytoactinopolyspora halotolerans]|uniref:Cytochrome ubiquinol oxidase subunit I n=1 Tax=Phytoactinopolyspora halotolerans TaxID=1981512 RepID=A0A6L9SB98_9ACTN|nr:cytochrome ubiquinol oxidase subunit I [Phytoactinopolyspora halotolerans]NEE02333.1 cytochrome ubiquinol oxidase subunit I [Phytoactinopolyspora halotolerans]